MKVCVVQVNSRDDKEDNLQKVGRLIEQAAADGAELISLPEYVNFLGKDSEKRSQAESIPGPTSEFFMEKAKELGIYLHCGSILEVADDTTSYNTSLLISDAGEIIATYRKMHLFDVDIAGRVVTKESDTIKPGQQVVTADTPFGTVGLGICYDFGFPSCTVLWLCVVPNCCSSPLPLPCIPVSIIGKSCFAPERLKISVTSWPRDSSVRMRPVVPVSEAA